MSVCQVYQPATLQELAIIYQSSPDAVLLSGGTQLIPGWREQEPPRDVIYLPGIQELGHMEQTSCGAAVTLSRLAANTTCPSVLREAALSIAGPAVRNMATIGGNLATRKPACLATALLVLDATVERLEHLPSLTISTRTMAEVLQARSAPIISIRWHIQPGARSTFLKLGVRAAGGPNLCAVAVRWDGPKNPARCAIAVGSTGTYPHRLLEAETQWADLYQSPSDAAKKVGQIAAREAQVEDDGVADREYRRHLVSVFVTRALLNLVQDSNIDERG